MVALSPAVGTRWVRENGGMPPSNLAPLSGRYLSFTEREEIAILRAQGTGVREIAQRIGRCPSTISRELRRNAATRGGDLQYQLPSGTPTGALDVRKSRSSPRTTNCANTCTADSQASSLSLTANS